MNILFNEINKKKDGYIDFNEFRDHMMELIRKGRYDRRNPVASMDVRSSNEFTGADITIANKQSEISNMESNRTEDMMQAVLPPPDLLFKTIVIGEVAVGKSCLLHRAAKGDFMKKGPTIGPD